MKSAERMTVVKVGGSLFDLPDLGEQLWVLIHSLKRPVVLLFGGGHFVQSVREQAARGQVDDVEAHWNCIDAMSDSAKFGFQLLETHRESDSQEAIFWADDFSQLDGTGETRNFVFDGRKWLRNFYAGNVDWPENWEVTSDSIAALLALELNAKQLVVCKSSEPQSADLTDLAQAEYVDRFFPKVAERLLEMAHFEFDDIQFRCLR